MSNHETLPHEPTVASQEVDSRPELVVMESELLHDINVAESSYLFVSSKTERIVGNMLMTVDYRVDSSTDKAFDTVYPDLWSRYRQAQNALYGMKSPQPNIDPDISQAEALRRSNGIVAEAARLRKYMATWEQIVGTSLSTESQADVSKMQRAHKEAAASIGLTLREPKEPQQKRRLFKKVQEVERLDDEPIDVYVGLLARSHLSGGRTEFIKNISRMRIRFDADFVESVIQHAALGLQHIQTVHKRGDSKAVKDCTNAHMSEELTALEWIDTQDDRLMKTATLLRKYEHMVPKELKEHIAASIEHTENALLLRSGTRWHLLDADSTPVLNIPANEDKIRSFYKNQWQRPEKQAAPPKKVSDPIDHEAIAAARKLRAAEKLAASVALQQEQETHDAPIRETLDSLMATHDGLISIFKPSNKSLRAQHIVGGNSLEYELGKTIENPITDDFLKTYAGLMDMVARNGDLFEEEFMKLLDVDDRLSRSLEATKQQLYGNGLSQYRLDRSFRGHIEWLEANWDTFAAAISRSAYQPDLKQLARLESLIRSLRDTDGAQEVHEEIPEPETEEPTEQETPVVVEPPIADEPAAPVQQRTQETATEQARDALAALEEANRQAERLDWIPIPASVSDGDGTFVKAIRDDMDKRNVKGALEEYRVNDLLMFKELYDGQLYRASERVLGDSNRLYFVLTFTYHGKEYAIAENPVYGNATYVIREDLMPLSEGETVLSAAKLDRKYLRDFGIKQHKHDPRSPVSHADKIQSHIDSLASEETVKVPYRSSVRSAMK